VSVHCTCTSFGWVRRLAWVGCAFIIAAPAKVEARAAAYDPLLGTVKVAAQPLDLTIHDAKRKRDVPIFVYLPEAGTSLPVVMWSHGLGGSREGNAFQGKHWASRGYAAVFVQHPGSDTSVWKNARPVQRMREMQNAANAENFTLRAADIPAVLDQLTSWSMTHGNPLSGRLDLAHVAIGGHSFGAVTAQAVGGQSFGMAGSLADPRIDAVIAFSPSSPRTGSAKNSFGAIKLPWLLMTGTRDVAAIGGADLASRRGVYKALPPGDKYELVLNGAEHSAFTDRSLRGDRGTRNPNHHRAILGISTAFLDTYLKGDTAAREWLTGAGPLSILQPADEWQRK